MSSAVAEARRVLRTGGLLLDIHPTDEPSHLEVWEAQYQGQVERAEDLEAMSRVPVGQFDHDETLRDFTAATDAVAEAMDGEHGFDLQRSTTFDYRYFFDSLDELTDYLEDEDYDSHASASDALLERALAVMGQVKMTPKLVVVQKTVVTALRKVS